MEQALADHRGLGASYVEYQKSVVVVGGTPDSPEIWISKAACAELAKVTDALKKALELAQGTAPMRQRIEAVFPVAP